MDISTEYNGNLNNVQNNVQIIMYISYIVVNTTVQHKI